MIVLVFPLIYLSVILIVSYYEYKDYLRMQAKPLGLDEYAKHLCAKMILYGLVAIGIITGIFLIYLYGSI